MKYLHAMIRVKDLEESLRFYQALLGMKQVRTKRLEDCTLYFLEDENGSEIELTYNDDTPPDGYTTGNGFGHFAFACESLDKFTDKLNSLGYKYLYKPFNLDNKGSRVAFIKDPDGNEIELVEKVVWD